MRTAQEIFDTVATHLHTQRKRCVGLNSDEVEFCKYRGENGMMCAAGCLIPDEEYTTAYEGESWGEDSTASIAEKIGHYDLVKRLQVVHDDMDDINDFTKLPKGVTKPMRRVAEDFNLSPAILDTFEPL